MGNRERFSLYDSLSSPPESAAFDALGQCPSFPGSRSLHGEVPRRRTLPASPGCAAALVCKLSGWSASLLRLESWKPVLSLNEAAPGYSRAQGVSRTDSLFHQEVMKEPNHGQILLQGRVREGCPCRCPFFSNSWNWKFGDAADIGSNRRTNHGIEPNIFGFQESEIRVQVSAVGFDGVGCQASRGLKLQPFPRLRIL